MFLIFYFLIFYYIICVIGTFSLFSYIIYQEEKYWIKYASIYDIDFGLIGIVIALSIFLGFILFPYMIIQFIIGKLKE